MLQRVNSIFVTLLTRVIRVEVRPLEVLQNLNEQIVERTVITLYIYAAVVPCATNEQWTKGFISDNLCHVMPASLGLLCKDLKFHNEYLQLFAIVIYLVWPPGETTPSEAYGLADLVHEEAHPVILGIGSESNCLLGKLTRIFEISDSVGGLKVEKLGGVVNGVGEWGDIVLERAPRDRRSWDILSVKEEAKLSASEVNDVEVGGGDADLRQSNLFTVCQRRRFICNTLLLR